MSTNMIIIVAYTIVVKHFNWVRSEWVERVDQLSRKQFFPNIEQVKNLTNPSQPGLASVEQDLSVHIK